MVLVALVPEHLAKAHSDLVRSLIETFVEALMGAAVDALCGADYRRGSPERTNRPNGSRPEKWCIDHRVIRPRSYAVSDAGRAFSVPWSASGNLTGRTLARASRAHVAALLGPLLGLLDE